MSTFPSRAATMELHGPTSDSFELRIIGYHSAQEVDDVRETNRLRIYTRATLGGQVWTTIHPALLTWEILDLADWLDSISVATPLKPELTFNLPNLWLEVQSWSEERVRFRVYFEREHRPPWLETTGVAGEAWADLECSPQELNEWSNDLRQQITKFPPRGRAAAHRGL
ncbi:MAG: hypothetical protein HY234_04790 [Acidobacteria bacterium]|nr:hypothetical protein [Acidobacteriota bacterium]